MILSFPFIKSLILSFSNDPYKIKLLRSRSVLKFFCQTLLTKKILTTLLLLLVAVLNKVQCLCQRVTSTAQKDCLFLRYTFLDSRLRYFSKKGTEKRFLLAKLMLLSTSTMQPETKNETRSSIGHDRAPRTCLAGDKLDAKLNQKHFCSTLTCGNR